MGRFILTAAMAVFLCAANAHADEPEGYVVAACEDGGHMALLADWVQEHEPMPSPEWVSCQPMPMGVTAALSDLPKPVEGPYEDWGGRPFAVYEIDGGFFLVYWPEGYAEGKGA